MIIGHVKPSPAIIAGLTALFIVAAAFSASYFGSRAIDPRVTMTFGQRAAAKQASTRQTVIATTIDGEVARTAERTAEATALALSASLYTASEQFRGRTPRSTRDIVAGLASRN